METPYICLYKSKGSVLGSRHHDSLICKILPYSSLELFSHKQSSGWSSKKITWSIHSLFHVPPHHKFKGNKEKIEKQSKKRKLYFQIAANLTCTISYEHCMHIFILISATCEFSGVIVCFYFCYFSCPSQKNFRF